MPIRTKRWNELADDDDGFRLLVCRYRPRGLPSGRETWDDWWPALGPSRELHGEYYGKHGPPLPFAAYVPRYLGEMTAQAERIGELAARVRDGETVTLLCASSCTDPQRCHRTLLAALIQSAADRSS